ncbi:MAG: DnaJ-like domain-containing [Planctomycetota bacterium]|nr:MAG: DnaJ-like domain-containing [Planctomycetota bacterium]
MSERKPFQQTWNSWIDEQVAKAQREGAFDNLPGTGKPLKNLDRPYEEDWWLREFLEREQLSVTPEPIDLRARITQLREEALKVTDEREARRRFVAMNALIARLNGIPQPDAMAPVAPVDVDEEIRAWRRRRGAQRNG